MADLDRQLKMKLNTSIGQTCFMCVLLQQLTDRELGSL